MPAQPEFHARSLLFIPADSDRFLAKAANRGADLIVLDLEDGVAPSAKTDARNALAAAVGLLRSQGVTVYVRVNNEATLLASDVQAAVAAGATGILLPKVEAASQLAQLDALVDALHQADTSSPVRFVGLVETPLGLLATPQISKASPRLVALCFGVEDFSTAMEIEPVPDSMLWPAQAMAVAASAAGLVPIGLPGSVADFTDLAAYRSLVMRARSIGMRGAPCIHPAQVEILNEVFGGTADEIAAARRVLAVFDAAVREGRGAIALDGRMIDAPVANRARAFLHRHDARRAWAQANQQGS